MCFPDIELLSNEIFLRYLKERLRDIMLFLIIYI